MVGRDSFYRYKKFIRLFERIVGFMPRMLQAFMWDCSRPFEGAFSNLLRYVLLRCSASEVGDCVFIGRNVTIKNASGIKVGDNVSIHDSCYLDGAGGITIGDDVSIAHHVSILSTDHLWSNSSRPIKYNECSYSQVVIHNDVWVGCGARLLSGVRLESRTIVAAGAVVTKAFVEGNVVLAGIPAKPIKSI